MTTQPARGMRDFLPEDVRRREHVVRIIRDVYESYGFEPLETPAAENIDTLLGKYGDEGNKLIFKILRRGEHETTGEADLALRYDLTVPLARVVAEYQGKLPKIFKRYQIQPVWRADRPARGRFREFFQCDIDTIGSTSPVVEAEQIAAVSEILTRLGFDVFSFRLNHRGLLAGMLEWAEVPRELHSDALVALDKRDKIGEEGVRRELMSRKLSSASIERLLGMTASGPVAQEAEAEIETLKGRLGHVPEAAAALENLGQIVRLVGSAATVAIDKSLARGLSYYTGAIMEISVHDLPGSLGGGGRYDNLIGMFSGAEIPACGFSLGLERILVVMQERGMFPARVEQSAVDVLVAALEEKAKPSAMETAAELRRAGLRVDLYPEVAKKMDKLFKHVDQRRARFVAIIGGDEVSAGTVTLRNVATRTKETMARSQAASYIARTDGIGPRPTDER
jgi:histidyl-tRNA synthetase